MRKRDAKVESTTVGKIEDHDLIKHFSILNNRVYRLDTMTDITDQKYIHVDGYSYNVRKIAFYLIHGRWPARGFLLPWE